MSAATKEEQLEQSIQFLASEIREVKKKVEIHTHNIEQLVRAVRTINEWIQTDTKESVLQEEVDNIKLRLNEIQAKSHRKFPASGEKGPNSLDNME